MIAAFVSSEYSDSNFSDGIAIILNRFIANADGLEYYMLYNGYEKIESGLIPYFLSIFGIYIKSILNIEYKNIGHQLSELVLGELSFAQGSNYTLFLQVMVIGPYLLPLYVLFVAILTTRMRKLIPRNNNFSEHLVKYFFVKESFFIVHDPEFGSLKVISFLLVYFLFFYPIIKVKFKSSCRSKI